MSGKAETKTITDSKGRKIPRLANIGVGRHYLDEADRAVGGVYDQRHAPTSDTDPDDDPTNNQPGIVDNSLESNRTISFTSDWSDSATRAEQVAQRQQSRQHRRQQNRASSTARLQRLINTDANNVARSLNSQHDQQQATRDAAIQKYHQAWQKYYNQYYRNYYLSALEEQKEKFAEGQATVVDSREHDGTLSQGDVQAKLKQDITADVADDARTEKHAARRARWQRLRSKVWFWPSVIALIAVLIFLFLQYNSVVAAWVVGFISPGSSSTQTIIVGSGSNTPVSDSPRVIIPKINVNAPVTYGLTSLDENTVQTALRNGAVNYPVTGASAVPGQKGNTVILGHSSADAFAPGNYKFIFVQLNRLSQGDLFYLDYANTRYTYKVSQLKSIAPTELNQLDLGVDKPYATLVTCDPPGTVARRLLVIAEQVSPNPNAATTVEADSGAATTTITGKPKTLLEQVFGF